MYNKYFLTIFLICYSTFAIVAKPVTEYRWMVDPNNSLQGQCFEVDNETQGQKYATKTYFGNCRTKKLEYKWIENKQCYEFSSITGYSAKVSFEKCRPKYSEYYFHQGSCYLIDSETGGEEFNRKVNLSKCRNNQSDIKNVWLANKNRFGGRCYKQDSSTGYKELVSDKECRPKQVIVEFVKNKDGKGECLEINTQYDLNKYNKIVSLNNCKPKRTKFEIRTVNGVSKCYEVSVLEDIEYEASALNSKCKPSKTTFTFYRTSPINGQCFEEDILSKGANFRTRVDIEKCRTKSLLTIVTQAKYKGLNYCLELDEATNGEDFIKKLPSSSCSEEVGKPTYIVSKFDEWRGRCESKNTQFGKLKTKNLLLNKCRPKDTIFFWRFHNDNKNTRDGQCYEIDAKLGHRSFAQKVDFKKCRPSKVKIKFHFPKDSTTGFCIEFDSQTNGNKYSKKISKLKCRKTL